MKKREKIARFSAKFLRLHAIIGMISAFFCLYTPNLVLSQKNPASRNTAFIENKGQWDSKARFLAQSPGLDMWITDDGIVYDIFNLRADTSAANSFANTLHRSMRSPIFSQGSIVAMQFTGALLNVISMGAEELPTRYGYFSESNQAIFTNLFSRASLANIYEGIDIAFYYENNFPRYDLLLKPEADPSQISMKFLGADEIVVAANNEIIIKTSAGEIHQNGLQAYQIADGTKKIIPCSFILNRNLNGEQEVKFALGSYDKTTPLVIDPLVYTSYAGGNGNDQITSMTTDQFGNVYLVGGTNSKKFPIEFGKNYGAIANEDMFVWKFTSQLNQLDTALIFSPNNGIGFGELEAQAITIDKNRNMYIASARRASVNPKLGYDTIGVCGDFDIAVTKISKDYFRIYHTVIGGNGAEIPTGIAVDNDIAYITGATESRNFPIKNAYQDSGKGDKDAFISALSADGKSLVFSTYFGGNNEDEGRALIIDENLGIFLTGTTQSVNFPANSGQYQNNRDIFLANFSKSGTLRSSRLLGTSGNDYVSAITIDEAKNLYLVGSTTSPTFPGVKNGKHNAGKGDAFVMKLNSFGEIQYSSLLGGRGDDMATSVAVDQRDNIYITGTTQSDDFPITKSAEYTKLNGNQDAFVAVLNPNEDTLFHATYFGGSGNEVPYGLVLTQNPREVVISGVTNSFDFPTKPGAFQRISGGGFYSDGFLSKFDFSDFRQRDLYVFPDTLDFGIQLVNAIKDSSLIIINYNDYSTTATITPLNFTAFNFNSINTIPAISKGGFNYKISVHFKPVNQGTTSATILIQSGNDISKVVLKGEGRGPGFQNLKTALAVPKTMEVAVGEVMTLPLILNRKYADGDLIQANITKFRATLSFNSTDLEPISPFTDSVASGFRFITIDSKYNAKKMPDTLAFIQLKAFLGDAEYSSVKITSFQWINADGDEVHTDFDSLDSGTVHILDVWHDENGNPRLVNTIKGVLSIEVSPNPSNGNTLIQANNYSSDATLKIYDLLGNEISNISDKLANSSSSYITISTLPAGKYFCRLTSGKFSVVRMMIVQ